MDKPIYPFSKIKLDGNDFSQYHYVEGDDVVTVISKLSHLSQVNFFVGPNNSGKSRFLRSISKMEYMKYSGEIEDANSVLLKIGDWLNIAMENHVHREYVKEANEMIERVRKDGPWNTEGTPPDEMLSSILNLLKNMVMPHNVPNVLYGSSKVLNSNLSAGEASAMCAHQAEENWKEISGSYEFPIKFDRIYIPTLRSLRQINKAEDIFAKRTREDYFSQSLIPSVFTGQTFYSELKGNLLGERNQRERIRQFEEFIGDTFYQGDEFVLIPKESDENIHVKIGREKERPIYELGDGIQSIILLTFPAFMSQGFEGGTLIFIEEPELFLHPGLQRILIETFLDKRFRNCRFFLSTHSNHLLDLTLDVSNLSIYSFEKELDSGDAVEKDAKFTIRNLHCDDFRILQLLGVQNSAVFLSNCTIWAEGITDRRYLQRFLELYQAHLFDNKKTKTPTLYMVDLHYSFIEYGGGNITHWSFLDQIPDAIDVNRICSKLLLVADLDEKGKKAERHKKLQEALNDRFVLLDVREIENILTPDVLKRVILSYENDGSMFKDFPQSSYINSSIGKFIEEKFLQKNATRKGGYAEKSGTVKDKVEFCNRAIAEMDSFESLSPSAKRLTERIYDFIQSMNL